MFSERLDQYLDRLEWPKRGRPRRLAELTGAHYNTAYRWLNGDQTPTPEEIEELAKKLATAETAPFVAAWLLLRAMPPPLFK